MFNKSYAHYYDLFNSEKPYKQEIEFVYRWAEKPQFIFDIGCGTGNYWKYYPKSVSVVGIDKSPAMADPFRGRLIGDITKFKPKGIYDCATALFDVINYIPKHDWWKNIPVKKGGYFIFDMWDKQKVLDEGFKVTFKNVDSVWRLITPLGYDSEKVDLRIEVITDEGVIEERHRMYFYSIDDIKKFCGKEFELVDVKSTKTWQQWVKCKRK